MKYRKLGRTGYMVSEVGMGCEGFEDKSFEETLELVDAMEQHGINCMDLYTPNPKLRSNLGQALLGRREKFVLQAHICTTWKDGQYKRTRDMEEIKASFADLLERMETDHIEVGMIHYVDSMAEWDSIKNGEIMKYAQDLKNSGKIGALGLSSHNPAVALDAAQSGLVDVMMLSVNPCYDLLPAGENIGQLWDGKSYENQLINIDPTRYEMYEKCQNLGVAITVMKVFGGGDLLSAELSPAGKALTVYQCIHYALTRPGVASVLIGAKTAEQIKASVGYSAAPESEKDYAGVFAALPKISWQGHCMYCGHCAPCSVKIDVADVTKFLNLALAQGEVPETVREHYEVLEHHASECIACGECESRCPFGVPVIENMQKAAGIFGK